MTRLDGKVALVTGASGGLGGAVTAAFVAAGAQVIASARRSADAPAGAEFIAADLTDEKDADRLVAGAIARHGRLDVLVHLVGGYAAGDPVATLPTETWRRMLALNLDSAFFACRAAVGPMLQQRWGRILLVGSRAAVEPTPGDAAYAVSKSGVVALARSLADEVRADGVTVNAILPGTIDTPANRAAMPTADASRWVAPSSLAAVLLFLASDEARDVTGALVPVYGRS